MPWKAIELAGGALIVLATVIDLFGTVVVPGRVRVGLRIPSLIRWSVLPGWRRLSRRLDPDGRGTVTSTFAAFLLFGVFLSWVMLLMGGLALMNHALRDSFSPPLDGFADSLFQTGSSMMTLGLNGHDGQGWGRLVVVLSGICGLQVVTLTLTYIVQLQMALQQRDPLVLRLECRGGAPPSGLHILLLYRELALDRDLGRIFERWEEWTAVLRQTHGAHPVLVYFRSGQPHDDWVTALGAVMDAATLVLAAIPDGPKGNAELLYRNGLKTICQLCGLMKLTPSAEPPAGEDAAEAVARLERGGYRIADAAAAQREIERRRAEYAGHVRALAHHFGVEAPRLAPSH